VHEDKTPAYVQIVNAISDRLASGVYGPGSKLPSESQFCAQFGVSPMTLRRALLILADRGLIATERGKGTFVRSFGLSDSVFTLEQLTGEWADGASEVRLLSASTVKADRTISDMLAIPLGSRVVYLRSILQREKTPAVYHTEYVIFDPRRPLVESQLQLTSLHGLLESGRGRGFPRGEVTLSALSLDEASAEVLGMPVGTSALCLEHLFMDAARRPMSWGRFLLRSDLFRLRARLGPE
jgi:DNA-binding GntR family transcriptional regulator